MFKVYRNTVQVPANLVLAGKTQADFDIVNGLGRCRRLLNEIFLLVCSFRLVLSNPGVGGGPAACAAAEMG